MTDEQREQARNAPDEWREAVEAYAQLVERIAQYAEHSYKCADVRDGRSLSKEPSTAEERERAEREYREEGHEDEKDERPELHNDWILCRILDNRVAEQVPPLPFEEEVTIGIPLALAMCDGGDPFQAKWENLDVEFATVNLPDRTLIHGLVNKKHDGYADLFSRDSDMKKIADGALDFADYLRRLLGKAGEARDNGTPYDLNVKTSARSETTPTEANANEEPQSKPNRGRPRNPNGTREYSPTKAKLLAAIAIIEVMRDGKASTIESAVGYCQTHAPDGSAEADFKAFTDGGRAIRRWARFNHITVSELRRISLEEWERVKGQLR